MHTIGNEQNRNTALDAARAIGTLLIILAHTGAPEMINEIRCFDVVLLVFLSGCCIHVDNYRHYLWKRFKRLVVPAWILEVVLFCFTFVACLAADREQIYSASKIIRSFFFLNGGIGFIWIVRVYLGIAVLAPVIVWVNRVIRSDAAVLVIAAALILLISAAVRLQNIDNSGFVYYITEIIAYGTIALIGYRYRQIGTDNESKSLRFGSTILVASFVWGVIGICLIGFHPNHCKYPPTGLYLFYGLFMSVLLMILLDRFLTEKDSVFGKMVRRFSMLSYDVYLVHILMLSLVGLLEDALKVNINWAVEYLLVLLLSVTGAAIEVRMRELLKKKFLRA